MAIFNSLGSNYSKSFVLKSLFGRGSALEVANVREYLGEMYDGKATLTYKGRQALEIALRRSGLPAGSRVGINGFTCYVVYQAVKNAGLEPVFIDVAKDSLHFSLVELSKVEDLAAVIIQNTLGLPADVPEIAAYAKKHKMVVIEDLAHSMGAVYKDGQQAGKVGELVMLSFSQDKPIDVVAGGAFIDRRPQPRTEPIGGYVSGWQQVKNRWYPFWTAIIRGGYKIGIGRYIHFVLKKLNLLATPMSDNLVRLHNMSPLATHLLTKALLQEPNLLIHRRQIASIYEQMLPKKVQYKYEGEPSFLRFPVKVDDRDGLVNFLKKSGIYIGDTWYDAPIAPKRYLEQTSYVQGECPEAEKVAAKIVNLPTHRYVTTEVARDICAKIKQWQTS